MKEKPAYLYVEDDPLSREVFQVLMSEVIGNDHITILEDSADFITRLEGLPEKPDYIFLDIHIEPLNGYQLLKMLRDNSAYHETRIIAVTASVMLEEVRSIRAMGFDGTIAKPFDMRSFASLIRRLEAGEPIWMVS